jgi:hypothetical protein
MFDALLAAEPHRDAVGEAPALLGRFAALRASKSA